MIFFFLTIKNDWRFVREKWKQPQIYYISIIYSDKERTEYDDNNYLRVIIILLQRCTTKRVKRVCVCVCNIEIYKL